MNVKRGARGFSTLPGLTKASRRHFPPQPICVGRKEVLTIVGHFTFPVSSTTVDHHHHQRVVTRRIIILIKINPLDETICTALRLRDKKKDFFYFCPRVNVAQLFFYITPMVHGSPSFKD
jgi:hypothetical protein